MDAIGCPEKGEMARITQALAEKHFGICVTKLVQAIRPGKRRMMCELDRLESLGDQLTANLKIRLGTLCDGLPVYGNGQDSDKDASQCSSKDCAHNYCDTCSER